MRPNDDTRCLYCTLWVQSSIVAGEGICMRLADKYPEHNTPHTRNFVMTEQGQWCKSFDSVPDPEW